MTELEKLVNEKKGGSRNAASSNSYLSELVEKKKAESKAWTPYADAAKGNSGAKNLYAAAARAMQNQSRTPPSLYADAAAQLRQQSGNAARGSNSVLKTIFDKADERTPTLYSGKYADYMKAGDYSELSKSAGSKRQFFGDEKYDYINNIANFRSQADVAQAQGRGGDYGKYAFMTSDEVGVYNYLYATQGRRAANRFLSDIEPELDKQWYSGANRGTVEVLGKNAGTRALASAMTVAAQPVRNLTSVIAMGEDAVRSLRGQEINPYSKWRQPSNITQELRGDTASHIEETNPGLGGKVGSFVYNTAMSAADSAVNMLVAKGFGEAAGFSGPALMSATNVIGSLAMSSEVASLSIAESKEKGYSNEGALALGLTRGAIEFASEAVGGEWAIKIFKQNPTNLIKSVLLAMAPEGVEEVMSDAANGAVNLVVDALFGTQESGIPKMLEYYKQNGTPFQKEHPELATFAAILGQEGLSFLGGALASVGSSTVQSYSNKQYVNYVAEQLDTTAQDVVQMMRDAKTDDPGVVYALAELVDAKNADELRAKVGTGKDMERAAAYMTRQMETGARSDAKESTYTAQTKNAPVGAQRAQNEGISTTPAAAINIQEGMNNGQSTYHREESGAAYVGSRGQAAEGAEGGLQALTGGRTEVQRGVGTDAQADLRQVTPAQLGIRGGGNEAITLVDAQRLDTRAQAAYDKVTAAGLEPVAFRGEMFINGTAVNGYVENGRVYFRVDAKTGSGLAVSPALIAEHELFHANATEEMIRTADEVIRESMTAEEYDAMRDAYKADYAGVYDFANMSVDEIERLLTEEIAADAYAGLNWFSGDAPVQEAVRAETQKSAPAQRTETQQQRTGPPEGRTAIEVARSNGDIQRNVLDYADKSARNAAQRTIHNRMVSEGKTLDLTENRESASQYFPDLRAMPKAERTSILREKIRTLKNDLRTYLNQLKGVNFEFEINGNTIEATIYNAGIKEVLQNLTQDKAGMLTASEEIFRNAEYLYSTQDKTGSSTITGWDYFYVPVKMGGDTVGVRIAVRNTVKPREAQIYNWGIKKGDTSLDGVGHLPKGSNSADVSSDASHNSTIRSSTANSQEKSSGRASVEVENRTTDNKTGSSDTETGSSDNKKPSFDNETARAFVKSYSALQRVVDERTAAYQEATKADDPNYDYETESKWLSKASQELARNKAQYEEALNVYKGWRAEKRKRNVRNTRNDLLRVFSTDRASRADAEQFMNQKIGEMMMQGEVSETALNEITDRMLETVSVTSSSKNSPWIDETYENIRDDLKGSKIYVSEKMWKDFRRDEAQALRERAKAAGIKLTNNPSNTSPDVRNMELAERYGTEIFPTDISASDMLRNIIYCAEKGENKKQTLSDQLWDEARLEGLGKERDRAYDRMVNELRDKTETILREFARDNKLKLKDQTKSEVSPAKKKLRDVSPWALTEAENKALERADAAKAAAEKWQATGTAKSLFQKLLADDWAEVRTRRDGEAANYRITMDTNGVERWAVVKLNGREIQRFTEFDKNTAAQKAAEYVDAAVNARFTEALSERKAQLEAEKAAEDNARTTDEILNSVTETAESKEKADEDNARKAAEVLGATESELNEWLEDRRREKAEKGLAADKKEVIRDLEKTAESKVTDEVAKERRKFTDWAEDFSSGAMRMFVNAGDTVRRIAKATGNKSLEGYYFNAGAYSQRAGNWIAKGGARTDAGGHKTGESLMDMLAPMRKDADVYHDFQLYLLHMHNVDRMKYDNTAEIEQLRYAIETLGKMYPRLVGMENDYLFRTADRGDPKAQLSAEEKASILEELKTGAEPEIMDITEAAQMLIYARDQQSIAKGRGLKPVFGYDVTAYDSQTAAKELLNKHPEFKEWAKKVYAYSDDLIAYRVESGLISQRYADNLKKRYPHYVPTLRVEGTNGKAARRARKNGGIVVSDAVGRAVGSDAVLLPLHTSLSRKTVAIMKNAGINLLGRELLNEYDTKSADMKKYIRNVQESEFTPSDQSADSDELYQPVSGNRFSVLADGKRYEMEMDEGLTQALNAFQPDKYGNLPVAQGLKKLNDLFKALCTGYNPFFMVRNFARDWQDAGFYSTDWTTWEKMYPVAITQIARNGEIWQQYKALGGSYASMLDYTTGMVKEPKNLAGKAWARYESFGQAIEAAPRLAEFMTILANKGGSKTVNGVKTGKFTQSDLMEAMLGAADITTNFARGGTVTKMLNKYLVPFLNPSVQGFDKFIRNALETRSVKAGATLVLKAALMGILPSILNALKYRDDDEWDDIPANTKANYYLIKLGNGYWIKIPKGRAIAVLSTAAVYGQEKLNGRDVKFSDVFEVVKSNVAPTDIFNQNIATTLTQAKLLNPDNPGTTWYGGNIESERLQNYRPGDRYDEKTDAISKAVGKFLGISPKKLNYVLDQYSGVIGDILLPYITPATSASHPLLSAPQAAFTIDTTSNNRVTSEYYDLLDDLKYDKNDGDLGAEITRRYVSHAGDDVNDYYAQIREIQNDKVLSKGEKNRLVRALKAQLIERQREIIDKSEPYREAVNKYLKEHPELSSDNDAAIVEFAEKYDITEEQAENRMDAIVYREINREIFGAEYALRTYSSDVYDKARTAYGKGVSYDTYYDYYFATKDMHADKDENGKSISGSKKKKVVEYINSLDIPAEQKDALYIAAGYKENSLRYQPWNGGSGSGRGGRRSRKAKALKAPAAPKAAKNVIPEVKASTAGTKGNTIADFAKMSGGTDIRKATEKAVDTVIKHGNRTITIKGGSPLDYFLKYGKLPSSR